MSEAVAVPKPAPAAKSGSGKVVFAGIMVFVLLAAFAVAFYLLGGVDLVTGLANSWFAAAPTPTSSSQPPKSSSGAPAGAVATGTPSSDELKLPDGVDEAFAKRVYGEMLESQENIQKLVEGDVTSFKFGTVKVVGDKATVPMTVTFKDKTSAPGAMELDKKGGKWYLAWVAGGDGARSGLAAGVAVDTDENTPEHLAETARIEPDIAVLNTMLERQSANQDVISAIIDGTYTAFTCDKVTQGPGTSSIDITLTGPKTAAMKGRVLCISKDIDGTTTWFLTSFSKS